MKKPLLALLLVCQVASHGAELSVKGLNVPQFDAEGRMSRRLKAESATGPADTPKLQNGNVEFFDVAHDNPLPTAKLGFVDAIYHRASAIVDGDGQVHLTSARGDIAGEGFTYELDSGKLLLRSAVTLQLPTATVSAKEGQAVFAQEGQSNGFVISRASLTGGVVVTEIKSDKYNFDRAETESAVYNSNDGKLRLASPVICWRGGEKTIVGAEEITIDVGSQRLSEGDAMAASSAAK